MVEAEATQSPAASDKSSNQLQDTKPWIDYAAGQALYYQQTFQRSLESFLQYSKSRLSQIQSTSSAHSQQTLETLYELKSEYAAYENIFFGKIKEGIYIAQSHPMESCGIAAGLGIVLFKRPRRTLYYGALRRLMSEETLTLRAEDKVKKLREAVDLYKIEIQKVQKETLHAEEQLNNSLVGLRQHGKSCQGLIRSSQKMQQQAADIKDVLGELPRLEASKFGTQLSNAVKEVKRGEKALSKEVTKITNHGISI